MVRDLSRSALLDGDLLAAGRCEVNGGPGRGDVKRNAVLLGEDGDGISADLVGDVAVGGDAIRPDDDCADLAETHHGAGHVVRNDSGGDSVMLKFPGGEARA